MNFYKTLLITCLGLLASASSLAAWSSNNNQHSNYEPADGYYSEPYYQGGRVSEANYDERAMGPYYNNDNRYNSNNSNSNYSNENRYNSNNSNGNRSYQENGTMMRQNTPGYISMGPSSPVNSGTNSMNNNMGSMNNNMNSNNMGSMNNSGSMYNNNSGSMYNNNNNSMYNNQNNMNSQGARQGLMNSSGYISMNDATTHLGDKVRNAIQKDTALSSNARAVLVTADGNGNVTLSGSVSNASEKAKVEDIAKNAGATSVKNNISVQSHR